MDSSQRNLELRKLSEADQELIRIITVDPIVHALYMYYHEGKLTWTEFLLNCVIQLHLVNLRLTDDLVKKISAEPSVILHYLHPPKGGNYNG